MNDEYMIVGFDLSWAGKTGVAWLKFRDGDRAPYDYAMGEIKPASARKKNETKGMHEVRRVLTYTKAITDILNKEATLPAVICYEDNRSWLLSASKRRGREKPVTRASMFGMVVTIPCLLNCIGEFSKTHNVIDVLSVNNREARSALDVSRYCDIDRALYRQLESMKAYDGGVKAAVGVAVSHILRGYGFGKAIPLSDHQADAMMMSLYTMGKVKNG